MAKPLGKRLLGRPKRRSKDVKMITRKGFYEGRWIQVATDHIR
jgi:hypothetical protein